MTALARIIERRRREPESWRYTDVEKLLHRAPSPSGLSPQKEERDRPLRLAESGSLLFIDGVWQPEQSRHGAWPRDLIAGSAVEGYRLKLADQTCLATQPVELLFVTTGRAPEIATKLHIELGASGRLTLMERHESSMESAEQAPSASLHAVETTIVLHPQAKLVHGKMVRHDQAAHVGLCHVDIAEGAYYDQFTLLLGGRLTRNEIEARLNGKLAQCALNGAMLLRGRDHADTTTRMVHEAPGGSSRQMYKSVIGGQARGVFQGKIVVAKGAQKTDGRQISRALLLSDQAEMDAKPELEIDADDVSCSHGSTIGELDAEALFYLRSRGVGEDEARSLLIEGFVGEALDTIQAPEWQALCREAVSAWLS